MMAATSEVTIIRLKGGVEEELQDQVASETAFTLQVNGKVLVSLLCSPNELDTMAVGFLLSEGLLRRRSELLGVEVNQETSRVSVRLADLPEDWETFFHKKTLTSGCGQGVTFSDLRSLRPLDRLTAPLYLPPEGLQHLLREFRNISDLYVRTGGVHSAAFTDGRKILLFSEDIGRHNAVDKLIGKAFLRGLPMEDKILLSSGRISGEIMGKVIRNRIPVLISRTAPTCMSITHAENNGVTLIGFARGNRLNIYTHPQNLTFAAPASDDGDLAAGEASPYSETPALPAAGGWLCR